MANGRPFDYWQSTPARNGEPRWAVGKMGPGFIVQSAEENVVYLVKALNAYEADGHEYEWTP